MGRLSIDVSTGGPSPLVGHISFAQATPWWSLRSGHFRYSLSSNGRAFSRGTASVGSGAYDIVLLSKLPSGVLLGAFKARAGHPGTSLLRIIHAAPELGSPALELDGRVLAASLSFTKATPYLSVNPGVYSLTALNPGHVTPLVTAIGLKLTPGVAYSSILVGSAGQRLRWVTVTDRGAPLTRPGSRLGRSPAGLALSGATSVTVQPGDSLWTIVAHHLGPTASDEQIYREVLHVWRLNARSIGTGDPNLIFPGQRIVFA